MIRDSVCSSCGFGLDSAAYFVCIKQQGTCLFQISKLYIIIISINLDSSIIIFSLLHAHSYASIVLIVKSERWSALGCYDTTVVMFYQSTHGVWHGNTTCHDTTFHASHLVSTIRPTTVF